MIFDETYNPFTLKGKRILVTGASSGIGVGIATECSKMGANVVITGRNQDRLLKTYDQLSSDLNNNYFVADISLHDNIVALVDKIPILDGIVLNAGIGIPKPIKFITENDINLLFQTNLYSSIIFAQQLIKKKKIAKGGSIVFISSINSDRARVGNSLYSATKAAINSFTKSLALELVSMKINVNCIQPGYVESNMLNEGKFSKEQIQEIKNRFPLGVGNPIDIASACLFFLSDAAKWITGSILKVDGGGTLK